MEKGAQGPVPVKRRRKWPWIVGGVFAFIVTLPFSLLIIFPILIVFLMVAVKSLVLAGGGTIPRGGPVNEWAHKWYAFTQNAQAKQAAQRTRRAEEEEERRQAAAIIAEIKAKHEEEERKGVDGRMEELFQKLRSDEITLDEYRAGVLREQENIKFRRSELRSERSDMDPDLFEMEMGEADDDMASVRWRLQWIDDQISKKRWVASIDQPDIADRGTWARFEYVDADGVITRREIVNWEKCGAYIAGYDKSRKAERTFRMDRISEWVAR